jgi:hypothetical protein
MFKFFFNKALLKESIHLLHLKILREFCTMIQVIALTFTHNSLSAQTQRVVALEMTQKGGIIR